MITQARDFPTRPATLETPRDRMVNVSIADGRWPERIVSVCEELESLCESEGVALGFEGLDAPVRTCVRSCFGMPEGNNRVLFERAYE